MPDLTPIPLQDRDLVVRLSTYVESLDQWVREGAGWVIFNATRPRELLVEQIIRHGLDRFRPLISSFFVPWRDVALNSYMEIEIRRQAPKVPDAADDPRRQALDIAGRVERDINAWLRESDLVVLRGISPKSPREFAYFERIVTDRLNGAGAGRSTVLLIPRSAELFAEEVRAIQPADDRWAALYRRLIAQNLVAV